LPKKRLKQVCKIRELQCPRCAAADFFGPAASRRRP